MSWIDWSWLVLELVLLYVVVLIVYLFVLDKKNRAITNLVKEQERLKTHLHLLNKKYFKHELNSSVYTSLLDGYQEKLVELELEIRDLQGEHEIDVEGKLAQLLERIERPTSAQRHRLQKLLVSNEKLSKELVLVRNKLLKREINKKTFDSVSRKRHERIIEGEEKIRNLAAK